MSYSDPARPLSRRWIEKWCQDFLAETPSSAMLVLDPTKSVYQSWAIPSNVVAAWGLANSWYYAKAFLTRGKRSIEIQGEAGQLGADFLLGPGGIVKLVHYCKNPTDRVAVSKILEALREYQSDK